ncbi:MAG: glutamine synthetase family protein [Bulleidia sp.]|nr:glutamine synthetase family protein [Bulleidia sp.]
MMQDQEELKDYIETEDIKFIRLVFFDILGNQKNKAVMPSQLNLVLKGQESFDGSAVAGFGRSSRSDLLLYPDVSTMAILPWRPLSGKVARLICDVNLPDGTPFAYDTRRILKEACAKAEKKGIHVTFGTEMEFYLFRMDENGKKTYEPIDEAGYMDTDPSDHGDNIRRDICFALLDMGITPEASHHERGRGQNEVDFRYGAALKAADDAVTFRWTVRSIAGTSGAWADFSPKPLINEPGSGMHVNFAVSSDDGEDHTDAFLAGVLSHAREMTYFFNPDEASYRRLGRMEAPMDVSWGYENRDVLVRIPAASDERKRMELRSPDASANPYLVFAMVLEAGLEGVEKDMKLLGEGTSLGKLPQSLREAKDLAEASDFVKHVLPEGFLDAYTKAVEDRKEGR